MLRGYVALNIHQVCWILAMFVKIHHLIALATTIVDPCHLPLFASYHTEQRWCLDGGTTLIYFKIRVDSPLAHILCIFGCRNNVFSHRLIKMESIFLFVSHEEIFILSVINDIGINDSVSRVKEQFRRRKDIQILVKHRIIDAMVWEIGI